MKKFLKKHRKLLCIAFSIMMLTMCFCLSTFATEGGTPTAIPTVQPMDLSVVQNLWTYGAGMLMDTIAIVSSQDLLVILVIALPLIGIGIGLFKRIIN